MMHIDQAISKYSPLPYTGKFQNAIVMIMLTFVGLYYALLRLTTHAES